MGISADQFFGSQSTNISDREFLGDGELKVFDPRNEEDKLSAANEAGGFLESRNDLGARMAEQIGAQLKKRGEQFSTIAQAELKGEQTFLDSMLQVAGKVGAGAVLDIMGTGLETTARFIAKDLSALTPDIIENPLKDAVTSAAHMFLNTDLGQKGLNAARRGVESYNAFAKENPRAARNIEAVIDIGLLAAPVKGKPKAAITAPGRAAQRLTKAAERQEFKTRKEFTEDLITPKQTAAVKEAQVPRTEEVGKGVLKRKVVNLSNQEQQVAAEVATISGVKQSNTLQGNFNAVSKEITREAQKLEAALKANDIPFPRKEFNARMTRVADELSNNPLIVGDAEKTAGRIVNKSKQLLKDKPSTVSNLLKVRKELDAWIKSQKGTNIFDPKQENALSIALRAIRQETNSFIDSKAVNVSVKSSLKKQSNLFRALDNIAPKAADEAGNVVLRAWKNLLSVLPLRGEFNQTMAAIFGLGGLGASAVFAPLFTKLVLGSIGIYATGRLIISPKTKRGLAMLLNQTDKGIRTVKDANLIRQLRIDRAALLELIQKSETVLEK